MRQSCRLMVPDSRTGVAGSDVPDRGGTSLAV